MNEKEVRSGYAICSVTGKTCLCESRARSCRAGERSSLDEVTVEALRWARTAALRLKDAADALDLAVDDLLYERRMPAPEWRDKVRRINTLIAELEEETRGS